MVNTGTSRRAIPGFLAFSLAVLIAACGGSGGSDGGGGGTPPPGGGGGPPGGGGTPPAATWTLRALGGDTLTAVARSSTTFVAISDDFTSANRVLRSTDAHTWSHATITGTPPPFEDLVFGNNLFVAVGSFAQVVTSPDGLAWTSRSSCACLDDLLSVAWSGSAFVAVGEAGIVRRSSDGITWTAPTTPPALTAGTLTKLRSVATSGTTFVAVGADAGTLDGAIVYSLNGGVDWATATVTPPSDFEFEKVAWDGARFIAHSFGIDEGGIWSSADGTSWTRLTENLITELTPTPGAGAAYIGHNGVAAMKTSNDAITWTD